MWISRSFLLVKLIPSFSDTMIAIFGGLLLFVLPGKDGKALLKWKDTEQLHWGIILLFGGGMALAQGFESSGLAIWLGEQFQSLSGVSVFVLLLVIIGSVNFFTEVTSNLATTAMLLPVLVAMGSSLDMHPFLLIVGATLAASCAFMLPVATPPNAVIFGSRYLRIIEMVRAGVFMNIVSILLLPLMVYFIMPLLWDLPVIP